MLKLESELWLPASIDEVWSFGSNPHNLAGITPSWYGVKIHAEPKCENNLEVLITMSPLGLPLQLEWLAKLSDVVSTGDKRQFVDTQVRGPFKSWRHTHLFESGVGSVVSSQTGQQVSNSQHGTWVRDVVEYTMPFGPLGSVAHAVFARKNLESMFAHRKAAFTKRFSK